MRAADPEGVFKMVISFNNFIYVYDETPKLALGLDGHFYTFVPLQSSARRRKRTGRDSERAEPAACPKPRQDGGTAPLRRYARTAVARRKRKRSAARAAGSGAVAAAAPRMWRQMLLALACLGRALPAGEAGGLRRGQPRWALGRVRGLPAADGAGTERGGGDPPRYRTAEMADAMLGGGGPTQQPLVLSGVPGEARAGQEPPVAEGGCDAAAGGGECEAGSGPAAAPGPVLETVLPAAAEEANGTDSARAPKVTCEERNVSGIQRFTPQILNVSEDLMELLNPNSSDCTLVLFYTPWCRFSANLAPHFNSLPRAFPTLRFLALDASQHSSLSTRFGTVAVPNILLFQGAKPMARFNHTDRTLETLKDFIFNQTGIEAKSDVVVTEEDWEGPLPSVLTKGIDWLLLFSLLFLASFVMYATIRTESIRWLIPGQEHEHQE
ncbi:thioredoxin domain-containing protein 15 [Pterocles gutturalis]